MQTVWKGAVSFGLVNVPVKMFTATKDNDIPMKMLHRKYNEPIRYSRTCPKCEKDVDWSDIVKGYEYESGHFVTFDKEEQTKGGEAATGKARKKSAAADKKTTAKGRDTVSAGDKAKEKGKVSGKSASEDKKPAPAKRQKKTGA